MIGVLIQRKPMHPEVPVFRSSAQSDPDLYRSLEQLGQRADATVAAVDAATDPTVVSSSRWEAARDALEVLSPRVEAARAALAPRMDAARGALLPATAAARESLAPRMEAARDAIESARDT